MKYESLNFRAKITLPQPVQVYQVSTAPQHEIKTKQKKTAQNVT